MYCSSACSCLHYIAIYFDVPCEGLVPESMFLFEKNSVCLNQRGTTGDVLCIYGEEICLVDFWSKMSQVGMSCLSCDISSKPSVHVKIREQIDGVTSRSLTSVVVLLVPISGSDLTEKTCVFYFWFWCCFCIVQIKTNQMEKKYKYTVNILERERGIKEIQQIFPPETMRAPFTVLFLGAVCLLSLSNLVI